MDLSPRNSSAADAEVVLNCYQVGHTYGDRQVLHDVTLAVQRGEVVAILGESGSGKTTLLKLVAGLLSPSSGSILLDSLDITGVPPWRRRIGYVPQNYALFPHLSVAENVTYALRVRHEPRDLRQIRGQQLLEAIGLSGLGERRVYTLSGGQQQRVALARALAAKPILLLLDEPFAAVDRNLRTELRNEIRSLVKELRMTTLCVTHDVDEAFSFADRVALLASGEIQQFDTPERVYFHPSNLTVARFLNPRNILGGSLVSRNHRNATIRVREDVEIEIPDQLWPLDLREGFLVIRPEVIRLNEHPLRDAYSLPARVADIRSLGARDLVAVALHTAGGPQIFAEVVRPHAELQPGQEVTIHFSKEDIHVVST